jgi:hypothetical protein
MKTIRLSDATQRAVMEQALLPFQPTGVRQPDGFWLTPVSDETWERLEAQRLPGESDDDLVMRILRAYEGRRPI